MQFKPSTRRNIPREHDGNFSEEEERERKTRTRNFYGPPHEIRADNENILTGAGCIFLLLRASRRGKETLQRSRERVTPLMRMSAERERPQSGRR